MQLNNKKELDAAIIALERKKAIQLTDLKKQTAETIQSLRPKNLLKSAFISAKHSSPLMNGIFKTVAGVGAGFLTKKLFIGKSTGLVSKLLGNAVRIGVAKTAMNNADKIKAYGSAIYNNLFRKNGVHR